MNDNGYIIVRTFGGMGNQLWQYAFARSLSIKYKKKLVLDISFYKNSLIDFPKGDNFKFELKNFNLPKDVLIEKNLYNHSYRFFKYFLRFLPNQLTNLFFKNNKKYQIDNFIFEDKRFKKKIFNESLKEYGKSIYFLGYWQNKEYFKNYYKIIQNDFKPKIIKKFLINFIKKLNKNHVAIHIRGGDIVFEKNYSNPTSEYYLKIIKFLKIKRKLFYFHIFTDDVKYAKIFLKKIKLKNYVIVSSKYNFSAVEEFFIMQHYKYFIINRSTFSWWAGHLSNINSTKIFVPKIWRFNFYLPKSLRSNNMKLF